LEKEKKDGFYSNKKFKKAKLCRYIRKHEYLDKWIKQNIFGLRDDETMNDFIDCERKILIVFGNGQWKYDCGLKFSSSISSSRQLAIRLQLMIREYKRLLHARQARQGDLQSCVDFVKVFEAYTSKICHECHHKSLKKVWKEIVNTVDGVEHRRWSQTRWFACSHENHVGKKMLNHDHNAEI
jgi:hypothetical protein